MEIQHNNGKKEKKSLGKLKRIQIEFNDDDVMQIVAIILPRTATTTSLKYNCGIYIYVWNQNNTLQREQTKISSWHSATRSLYWYRLCHLPYYHTIFAGLTYFSHRIEMWYAYCYWVCVCALLFLLSLFIIFSSSSSYLCF